MAETVRTAIPDGTNGDLRALIRTTELNGPYSYERLMTSLRGMALRIAPPGTTAIYWWHDQLIYELDHGLGDAYPVECCIWREGR